MADTPESIQKIRINGEDHPIDAVTLNEKSASDFLNKDGLVTSVNSSSDDEHYPSAKCVYDIIYDSNGGGAVTNNNYIKVTIKKQKGSYNFTATIDEIGTDYNINNSPEIYVDNTINDNWEISDNTIKVYLMNHILYLSPANYPTNTYIQQAGGDL